MQVKSTVLALFVVAGLLCGQAPAPRWEPLHFLLGKWNGAGSGEPGAGQGAFSFLPELDGRILVRRSFNQLASGQRHEDLMVVYPDGNSLRALYFDSEGHTISLSHALEGNRLNGRFEVGGKTYLTWTAVKE